VKCTFCGFEFDPDQRQACPACPLSTNCGKACCPRCGYEAVRPSPLVELVRGWLGRGASGRAAVPRSETLRLSDLPVGQQASVLGLASTSESRQSARLVAMGLLPGVSIRLLRRSPAYVFAVGNSQFAVDERLAAQILVQPEQEVEP
jgi:Fe2+ transport system protein FeoA